MEVDRTIEIRGEERVVRQQRKNHIRGILLISQLLRKGTTEAAGKPVQSVVADEVELLEKGREHVEGIRERASKRGKRQPAAAAAASSAAAKKAKRKGADAALSDPLALAHDGGTRSGATPETSREEAAQRTRHSLAAAARDAAYGVGRSTFTAVPNGYWRYTAIVGAACGRSAVRTRHRPYLRRKLHMVHKMKLSGAQYLVLSPPALLPLLLSLRAMPSYNRDLKPFAGEESINELPRCRTPSSFLRCKLTRTLLSRPSFTKLSLVVTFGHARAPPSPPPVKEISRSSSVSGDGGWRLPRS
ncbi:unnamed protein product [Ectocarpus sp. CCAP 1310/34]|nr:unnamed protein product [Ectocarpus sp. CCAP 1310/34]